MECAHRQNVVHRDLKPANILLQTIHDATNNTKEGADPRNAGSSSCSLELRGELLLPKIADFGLAKRLDVDGGQTRTNAVMGTPSYMAPEQAEGRAKDVSPATDVYALGAILYEALTGRPPFKGTSVLDTLEQVKTLDPVVPRRLQPGVPRDLETICLKCLAKVSTHRYESALGLADDVRRFLDGKPILARPTPAWEHVWKAAKRRPGISLLLALVFIVTLGGFLGIFAQWRRAERNADERWHAAYTFGINLTQQAIERNDTPRAQDLLESLKPGPGRADLRGFEWHFLNRLCHGDAFALEGCEYAAISPDGQFIAAGTDQGVIRICDTAGGEVATLNGHTAAVTALVFSQDGKLLISAAKDNAVKVWDWRAAEKDHLPDEHVKSPLALATSADGRLIASGGADSTIVVWDIAAGKKRLSLRSPQGTILSLAIAPDGRTLAARTTAEKVWLWNLEQDNAEPRALDLAGVGLERGLAYSPDGSYLATAIGQKTVRLWNAATLEPVYDLKGHGAAIGAIAFASSTRLVSGGWDRTIRIWDLSSIPDRVPPPLVLRGHRGFVTSVSIDRSGQRIVTTGMDHTARLWNLDAATAEESAATTGLQVQCLAYSPDGKFLATGGPDKIVRIQDRAAGSVIELTGHEGWINAVSFSPGGRELATGDENGVVLIWDEQRRQILHTLRGHAKAISGLAFSPDGRFLASSSEDGSVRLWTVESGEEVGLFLGHDGPVRAAAFSSDGRRLASAGADRTVRLWDVGRRAELLRLVGHAEEVLAVAFDATGKRLATGGKDRTVVVWDAATGEQQFVLAGHDGIVAAVAFDPTDPRRLATADSTDGFVKIWDLDTRQELLTLPACTGETTCLAFRPDGKELAAGGGMPRQGHIKFWRATPDTARGN
jgi:WD40 repeat protein